MSALKLVKRKQFWFPTWLGWILISLISLALVTIYMKRVHAFLSISRPVAAQILAVEEWVPLSGFEGAASEFESHDYILLVVIGDEKHWVIPRLEKSGVDRNKIIQIHTPARQKDRTFASAVALKEWLTVSGAYVKAVNIYTLGTHARRSWMLFREALGKGYPVGIISFQNPDYDPARWWKSSEGFKAVTDETIAYAYTQLFFLPARALK